MYSFLCIHLYNCNFKFQNLTQFGLIFKEMAKFISLTHIVKSLFQCMIFEDFLNLRGFGRAQGGDRRGRLLFCKHLNTWPIIQISAGLKFWTLLPLSGKCEVVLIWNLTIISSSECVNKGQSVKVDLLQFSKWLQLYQCDCIKQTIIIDTIEA